MLPLTSRSTYPSLHSLNAIMQPVSFRRPICSAILNPLGAKAWPACF